MMQALRNNTKPIFIVTIFAFIVGFIFLDIGRGSTGCAPENSGMPGAVAVVNGEPISYELYQQTLTQTLESVYGPGGGTDQARVQMAARTYNQLIEDVLLRQAAEKRGLGTDRDRVLRELSQDPPPEVLTSPLFLDAQGRFDVNRYYDALSVPQYREALIQSRMRRTPVDNLRAQIEFGGRASAAETIETHAARRQQATISFIRVATAAYGGIAAELPEDEVRAYYGDHAADYAPEESAVLSYLHFDRTPSALDTLETRDLFEATYLELQAGEEFDLLMNIHSEAPQSQRGGPAGLFMDSSSPEMTLELQAVLDTLEEGTYSSPFQDQFGFHIVMLDSVKTDGDQRQYRVKDIRQRVKVSSSTSADIAGRMYGLYEEARRGKSFEAIADTSDVHLVTTEPIDISGESFFIPRVAVFDELKTFVHAAEVGEISDPFESAAGWYVFRLDSRGPGVAPDLSEVEFRVRNDMVRERGEAQAKSAAEGIMARVRAGDTLETIAESDSLLRLQTSNPFARYTAISGIGKDPVIMGTAFGMSIGEVAGPYQIESGDYIVMRLDERDPAPASLAVEGAEDPTAAPAGLVGDISTMKANEILASYLERLRSEAKIIDLRRVRTASL